MLFYVAILLRLFYDYDELWLLLD